jgi:ABC-2 type transport system permease protein
MGKINLIIGREYLTRVRKKSFIIMTILGPVLIGAFMTLTIWLSIPEDVKTNVLVVDKMGFTTDLFRDKESIEFTYTDVNITKEQFLAIDSLDLMLVLEGNVIDGTRPLLLYKKMPPTSVTTYITSSMNEIFEGYRLQKASNPNTIECIEEIYPAIKKHVDLDMIDAETDEDSKLTQQRWAIGFVFSVLIYVFIFLYGVQVMRGVIEEKTSRIVEIIVSSVRPIELMLGKIIGIAFVGLTQFVLWIILTMVVMVIAQFLFFPDFYDAMLHAQESGTLISTGVNPADMMPANYSENEMYSLLYEGQLVLPYLLGVFLFYFICGYLLYSSMFAAIGAAVDSESDTNQFMMPITLPLLFGFIVAQLAVQNPDSNVVWWCSMFPLTSPVVMMVRVAMGVQPWELILSMTLLIAGFLFCTWLSAKIYRTGILLYGKKVTYKELWKWLFYKT